MATYTPDQYAVVLQKRAKAWRHTSQIAKTVQQQLRSDAVQLLSGTTSRVELRRLGHPFGREQTLGRRLGRQRQAYQFVRGRKQPIARGYMPRLPINKQSGALLRAMSVTVKVTEKDYTVTLRFKNVKSLHVLAKRGTRRMVARGFWREINRRMLYRKQGIIKAAKVSLLRP